MEKLSIKLKIGNREYPMTVKLEEEKVIREIGKKINEEIKLYQDKMKIDDSQDLLAMVAFDSYMKLSSKNTSSTESNKLLDKLKKLNETINESL
tara:strand:+ start:61 stop:342 length:282 start_codon:yes stop_codon:yes gene_type:complete